MKKGQVTVFILIGIILVAGITIVIFGKDYILKNKFERDRDSLAYTQEFEPIYLYFESCLTDIANEGAVLLGQQGGYLDVPRENPLLEFTRSLNLFDNDDVRIPYWFYQLENGVQHEVVPTKGEIESSLKKYVDGNGRNCVSNFTFPGYDLEGFNEIDTEVDIYESKVFVKVVSPVILNHGGNSQKIDAFFVTLDIPLGRLYDVASKIYERQKVDLFFEERTIDLLTVYDELPFLETDFSCTPKVWSYNKVESDFKRILTDNLGAVRVTNSNLNTDKYFRLPVSSQANVQFRYSDRWPLYLDIQPNDNGVLTGDGIVGDSGVQKVINRFLCLQQYHFVYDIQYPLLTVISDEDFVFQFATNIIIDNNEPRISTFESPVVNNLESDFCRYPIFPVSVSSLSPDRSGKLISLYDVEISYKCFTQTCPIGRTASDFIGESVLNEKFPQCLNGLIIGEKEGYYLDETFLSTNFENQATLVLESIQKKRFEVKIINENTGSVRNLFDGESVILDFESNSGHLVQVNYPAVDELELISDRYNIKMTLVSKDEIIIEEDIAEHCVDVPRGGILGLFSTTSKCIENVLDEIVLDQVYTGGAEFEFTFDRTSLIDSGKITFYVIDNGLPEDHENLNTIQSLISQNYKNINFRMPEYEN